MEGSTMGTGNTSDAKLARIEHLIHDVPGDLAEIGVNRGATFHRLVKMGARRRTDCVVHAFDSFEGMNAPTELDDGKQYPEGRFAVGGTRGFHKLMEGYGVARGEYTLWPGYVPDCFAGAFHLRFAFAYLDLDTYTPTVASLVWLWPKINPGGVLMLDDYADPDDARPNSGRAEQASNEWLEKVPNAERLENENGQLIVRKIPGIGDST